MFLRATKGFLIFCAILLNFVHCERGVNFESKLRDVIHERPLSAGVQTLNATQNKNFRKT